MARIYLGLGTNLGERRGNLSLALERLAQRMIIENVSSVYETDPVGYDKQPLYLNAVISAKTDLLPLELLSFVKTIEMDFGRKPSFRNAPRPIDIDILLYDNLIVQTEKLIIPHPRITERVFMLVPLLEIAPDIIDPVSCRPYIDLLPENHGSQGIRLLEGICLNLRTK